MFRLSVARASVACGPYLNTLSSWFSTARSSSLWADLLRDTPLSVARLDSRDFIDHSVSRPASSRVLSMYSIIHSRDSSFLRPSLAASASLLSSAGEERSLFTSSVFFASYCSRSRARADPKNCTVALIPFAASRCMVSSYSTIIRSERQCELFRNSVFRYALTVGVGASLYVVGSRWGTHPFGAFGRSSSAASMILRCLDDSLLWAAWAISRLSGGLII
mmetsp:Transcript_19937/g.50726  ORF Transcript_19937/g.50726 Transcript_19937/m.50726 type:complete len:220 (+) Transcript_19937:1229-1888(+)